MVRSRSLGTAPALTKFPLHLTSRPVATSPGRSVVPQLGRQACSDQGDAALTERQNKPLLGALTVTAGSQSSSSIAGGPASGTSPRCRCSPLRPPAHSQLPKRTPARAASAVPAHLNAAEPFVSATTQPSAAFHSCDTIRPETTTQEKQCKGPPDLTECSQRIRRRRGQSHTWRE